MHWFCSNFSSELNRFIFFTHFRAGLGSIHLEWSRFNFGVSSHYLKSLIKLLFENRFYYIYISFITAEYLTIFRFIIIRFFYTSIYWVCNSFNQSIYDFDESKTKTFRKPIKAKPYRVFDSTFGSILWKWEFV